MTDRDILDSYPLPIARIYRRFKNALEPRERHDAAYYLFEVYLKYLASVAVAQYLVGTLRDHKVNAALKGLARPSLGEWLRFLRECLEVLAPAGGQAAEASKADPGLASVAELLRSRRERPEELLELHKALHLHRTGQAWPRRGLCLMVLLDEIVAYRNRVLGHGAPLGADHYRRLGELLGAAFAPLLRATPLLTARRLVTFDSIGVEDGSRVVCRVIEHMGLQPTRRERPHVLRYGAAVPTAGRLHLLCEDEGTILLDPLLETHTEDVYFLNEADGALEYLSYSTGDRHRPPDGQAAQRELFGRILGYPIDDARLSRLGADLEPAGPEGPAVAEARAPPIAAHERLGDFRIVREIGRGGMGTVYEAFQESLGRRVALKVLPGTFSLEPRRIERFRREARATARVHHPNVVPVYEVGEAAGSHYYAMERIDGLSLAEAIDRARQPPSGTCGPSSAPASSVGPVLEVVSRFAALAEGLAEAHGLGLVHRDIKPSNILVDAGGRYVLIDFGLVHEGDDGLTRSGELIGTPGYMSPEQVSRGKVDARSDIYSLGVTLYEALTLHRPLRGHSDQELLTRILHEEPLSPRAINPDIPRGLETVIFKALEKDSARRYASMEAFAADLRRLSRGEPPCARRQRAIVGLYRRVSRRPWILRGGLLAVAAMAALWIASMPALRERSRHRKLVEVDRLADAEEFLAAFRLARDLDREGVDDPFLAKLWPRIAQEFQITTEPPGAEVSIRDYFNPRAEWIPLGLSPLQKVRLPRGEYCWRAQKPGCDTLERGPGAYTSNDTTQHLELQPAGRVPAGMVSIPAGTLSVRLRKYRRAPAMESPEYWIDRCEVTNRQYQEFVDAGGYEDPRHWRNSFVRDGRTLSWEEAMGLFNDQTNRSGPATWSAGRHPPGQEDFPVSGVSWFEAAAYAEFRGKSLPTVYHWSHAAVVEEATAILALSNFSGGGPRPAGASGAMGETGVVDMAGNVREWCWNTAESFGDVRFILGGAWGEPSYMFTFADAITPWDRSLVNGFRCMQSPRGGPPEPRALREPLRSSATGDFRSLPDLSAEEFRIVLAAFACDPTPLDATVELIEETEFWVKEKASFCAAYGGERVMAYLLTPRGVTPPYQTVIHFPGSGAFQCGSFERLEQSEFTEFVARSGRAVVHPVFKGMYERRLAQQPGGPQAMKELIVQMIKDLVRTVDYLATRPDVDQERMAYYGMSFGSLVGPIALVAEPRLRLGILAVGGFWGDADTVAPSESSAVHFASRVRVPVIMINAENDVVFPLEESARPMFERLGTPGPLKRLAILPGGHGLLLHFSRQIRGEVLGWLDLHFGATRRGG